MTVAVYSTPAELKRIAALLCTYLRLPFAGSTIPGAVMESVLARVRLGEVLNTYDFVDVIRRPDGLGWQVKSTKEATPVTWKRAKLPGQSDLIEQSRESAAGLAQLGDAILMFCNEHASASLRDYDLSAIAYSRLIVREGRVATYFERLLSTPKAPNMFDPADFIWNWAKPKETRKKEQLPALHGIHRATGDKWWAWHGQGENQLHFSGEAAWWPTPGSERRIDFALPKSEDKIDMDTLQTLLSTI